MLRETTSVSFLKTADHEVLVGRIEDLIDRILKVEVSREDWSPAVDDSAGA